MVVVVITLPTTSPCCPSLVPPLPPVHRLPIAPLALSSAAAVTVRPREATEAATVAFSRSQTNVPRKSGRHSLLDPCTPVWVTELLGLFVLVLVCACVRASH
ncbi:hypothetical protein E2C01_078729 [Portunus trituberculatus]|uniref:Uncharacterized protein n=1 Tax=Portunus trituberculatus TaxID=210409 RepID=A0A5B7IUW2_PORTR|nr:hypothetical protein [Portunus trituberculatus]